MTTFAITALLLIMVPGPDQALITRPALVGGRHAGVLTMLGGVLGVTVHATAAAAGVAALLLSSAAAFNALKIAGAAYLLWLGVQMLRSASRSRRERVEEAVATKELSGSAYLYQGFLSNALNPKVALFFVTLLPQFLSAGTASPRVQALLFSAIFAGLYLAWFGLYVAAVECLGRWLRKPTVRARVDQVIGALLVSVALRLAVATR
jgi:threonine/homoserine/homoserine lactone efflux protein